MTSDELVWYEVAWVASVAGVLLVVFLLLYLCVRLTVHLTDLERGRSQTLLFVSSFILLTFLIAAVSVHWCSQVKTGFYGSVTYLLFVACCVLLPLFLLLELHHEVPVPLIWDDTYRPNVCMVVYISVIIVSLNVLLLDAYEYCQRYEGIDVSLEALVQKAAQQFLAVAIFFPIILLIKMLLCTLTIDESIPRLFPLNMTSWSLRFSTLIIWLAACFAVPACYGILKSSALIMRFETLLRSDLRLSIPFSIVSVFCWSYFAFMSCGCAPALYSPLFYSWLGFLKWSVLSITLVATILVHVPATPQDTPPSLLENTVGNCPLSPLESSQLLVFPSTSSPSSSLSPSSVVEALEATPTQPVKRCMDINKSSLYEVQLKHLVYLEYLHNGESRELKIIENILGFCDKLADKFGFKTVSHSCSKSDAESCCRTVFMQWQVGDSPGYNRSWNGLLKALRELGLKRLVKDIETALDCVVAA